MPVRRILAFSGATIALLFSCTTAALAAGTSVSVRVEGLTHTLLPSTIVHTHAGSITKGGTPAGSCPATTAAGALDEATHHNWDGSFGSFGLSVTQILGESHPFAAKHPFWSIWVDNRFAPAGVCGLKLHRGEQLLFAAVPDTPTEYPIMLTGPRRVTAGHRFELKLAYYRTAKGAAQPLAGARVGGQVSNRHGVVTVTATTKGKLKYTATETGYIRSAAVTVRVN